ncbi:MAG: hypothetical protein KatS3mg031_2630 [Chitinophagales bacterium]|nr:MAG: hypothetical protein KatS3mg031_2630 [Chitinophagales bacterium]
MRKYVLFCLLHLCISGCAGQSRHNDYLHQQVSQAINKAIAYFEGQNTGIREPDVVILLYLLKEHFGVQMYLPDLELMRKLKPELSTFNIMLYNRYFDDRKVPSLGDSMALEYIRKNNHTIDGMNFWSMYCNRYPLADTVLLQLKRHVYRGHYYMTHAAMQLSNMLRLGCLQETPEVEKLKALMVKELLFEITTDLTDVSNDLRYESVAMLYYLGADTAVTREHIQWIVDTQMPDGGWNAYPRTKNSHPHPSVLALWALLEYQDAQKNKND